MTDRVSRTSYRGGRRTARSLSANSIGSVRKPRSVLSLRSRGTAAYSKVKDVEEIEMADLVEMELQNNMPMPVY
jgi:hypothetical protein